jgi:hypothetical protein
MTVNPAVPSFACDRQGQFAEGEELGLAIRAKQRGLGYGG